MVMFHSYVSLPEGTFFLFGFPHRNSLTGFKHETMVKWWWHFMGNTGRWVGYWHWWNIGCYRWKSFSNFELKVKTLGCRQKKNFGEGPWVLATKKNVILRIKLNHWTIQFWWSLSWTKVIPKNLSVQNPLPPRTFGILSQYPGAKAARAASAP